MTGQVNPPGGNGESGTPKKLSLQRGGEEFVLEKMVDRFTFRLKGDGVPSGAVIQKALPANASNYQILPRTNLIEVSIAPDKLEIAMQQTRTQENVAFASHVYQVQNNPGMVVYLTSEVTVQFADNLELGRCLDITTTAGLELLRALEGVPNAFIFIISRQALANPVKIAQSLMQLPEVLRAEPNVVVRSQQHYRPKDTLYAKQWYLYHSGGPGLTPGSHIDAEKAWDITRGSRSIVVAIADDSVDINHPDFTAPGKIVAPRDLKNQDFAPLPEAESDNHGTGCAGVAVAEENGVGVVGVAPGCALMPIRTTGFLDDEAIEELFGWAAAKGAAVISCSWGASSPYFPLSLRQSAAISRAATTGRNGKGCVILFAAGNANRPTNGTIKESGWPNDALQGDTKWLAGFTVHPDVITVAAATSLSKKAAYSNWGKSISVSAPSNNAPPGMWLPDTGYVMSAPQITTFLAGQGVFTTDRLGAAGYDKGDYTGAFGGTSSATPVVAGVAALVLSVNPDLTAAQVKQILQQTADKITDPDPDPQLGNRMGTYDATGHSQWFGYGKVNAYKAVVMARQMLVPPAPAQVWLQQRSQTGQAIPDYQPGTTGKFDVLFFGGSLLEGLVVDVAFSDSRTVKDIRLSVNIAHEFLGDLEIGLIAPNGKRALVQGRTLGSQTRLQKYYSVDNAPALKLLFNQPAKGTWKLQVCDRAPADTGTLNGWELAIGV